MTQSGTVDIHSDAFARRLANLLAQRRRERGVTLRKLARASGKAFTAQQLRAFEAAGATIDEHRLEAVADLYGADLELILADRLPLEVRPVGVLMTGGIAQSFTPGDETSLLTSYLRLVRQLRSAEQAPAIELRREDVDVLAEHLGQPGESIVDRLGALMGATVAQRRAMAGLFLSGALVIGLAGGSVAALGIGGGGSGGETTVPSREAATTTTVTIDPSHVAVERAGDVTDGARVLPTIVVDGPSHGAPDATPDITTTDSAPETTTPSDAASVESSGSPSVTSAPGTTLAPSHPAASAAVPEDTAVSDDGSIGVGTPVLPDPSAAVTDDPSSPDVTDADVPFDTDIVMVDAGDDTVTADGYDDDTILVDGSEGTVTVDGSEVDDATPPMLADGGAEQAVAPPPLP